MQHTGRDWVDLQENLKRADPDLNAPALMAHLVAVVIIAAILLVIALLVTNPKAYF